MTFDVYSRPKSNDDHEEGEGYFVSITDMMVGVVFVFLILLTYFALSARDEQQDHQALIERIREEISAINQRLDEIEDITSYRAAILREVATRANARIGGQIVNVDTVAGIVTISDADLGTGRPSAMFAVDQSSLTPFGRRVADALADSLAGVLPCYAPLKSDPSVPARDCARTLKAFKLQAVLVEGHTDKTGTDARNWVLSSSRAITVYQRMTERRTELRQFVNPDAHELLSVSGYADRRPRRGFEDDSAESYARNRRIDLRFILTADERGTLNEVRRKLEQLETEAINALD